MVLQIDLQEKMIRVMLLQVILWLPLAACQNKNPLEGKSFRLRTSIKIQNVDGEEGLKTVSELEEMYSHEQGRAKIRFQLRNRKGQSSDLRDLESGEFEMDARRWLRLLRSEQTGKCQLIQLDLFLELIQFRRLPVSLEKIAPDHIVGAARLLFFTASHRDKMRLASLSSKLHRVRNVPCLEYAFQVGASGGEPVNIKASYSELAIASDANSLPLQVSISHKSEVLLFEFRNLKIWDSAGEHMIGEELSSANIKHNPFMLELSESCTKALENSTFEYPFRSPHPSRAKFSFDAKVEFTSSGGLLETQTANFLVAYDALLSSMTVSNLRSGRKELYNFRANRVIGTREQQELLQRPTGNVVELNAFGGSTCNGGKIWRNSRSGQFHPEVGELLVGSNRFVYMGSSLVRGKPARVFMNPNANLPFWLDQPANYKIHSKDSPVRIRSPQVGMQNSSQLLGEKCILIVYLLEDENSSDRPQLLHMTLELPKENRQPALERYDRVEIDFFGFHWDIPKDDPAGRNTADLFSVVEACLSHSDDSHSSATFEVLLQYDRELFRTLSVGEKWNKYFGALEEARGRNLALLRSLSKEFAINPNYVRNLRSKLVRLADSLNILLKFTSLRQSKHSTELLYLNQGTQMNWLESTKVPFCFNFRTCVFEAAEVGDGIKFAFDSNKRACYIESTSARRASGNQPAFTFEHNDLAELEIYRLDRTVDLSVEKNDILEVDLSANMLDRKLSLSSLLWPEDEEQNLLFWIRRLSRSDHFHTPNSASLSKILQVGLRPKEGLVEEVELPQGQTGDFCRLSCLSRADCKAFSLCFINSHFLCHISKIDVFKQTQLVRMMREQRESKFRIFPFSLKTHNTSVEFMRNPSCELHRSMYLDLFVRSSVVKNVEIFDRVVHLSDNPEECARLCFQTNGGILSQHKIKLAPKLEGETSWKDSLRDLKFITRELCESISFISQSNFKSLSQSVQDYLMSRRLHSEPRGATGGFCLLGSRNSKTEKSISASLDAEHSDDYLFLSFSQARTYLLDFRVYFETVSGFSLLGSPKTEAEVAAYRQMSRISSDDEVGSEALELMRSFVGRGENSQQVFIASAFNCAVRCFMQLSQIWPSCKSFDVETIRLDGMEVVHCYLNSRTLGELRTIRRFDLIDGNRSRIGSQVVHFEPKRDFQLVPEVSLSQIRKETQFSTGNKTNSIVLIALISGCCLGVAAANFVLTSDWISKAGKSGEDSEMMVRTPRVRFSERVDVERLVH